MKTTRIRTIAEIAGTVLLAGAALWYWLLYFNRGTNLLDEGSQAAHAYRILQGDLIYRDFFTVVTPGSYYTVAWLFQLFGAELIVLRWAVLVMGLGILLVTLAVARHLVSWPFAAASAALTTVWGWFLVAPNFYSWQAMLLALAALLCHLRYTRTARVGWIWGAGFLVGAAALVKQNIGAYAAVALVLAIAVAPIFDERARSGRRWRDAARDALHFAAAISVVVLPVVLLLVASAAGAYLFESWVYYPLAVYPQVFSLEYPPFYPITGEPGLQTLREVVPALVARRIPEPLVYDVWITLVLYLPWLVYPAALVALAVLAALWRVTGNRAIAREGQALAAISVFGAFTFLQAWPRADLTHALFGMQPAFVLLGYLAFCVWRGLAYAPELLLARVATWRGPRAALHLVQAMLVVVCLVPHAALLWYGYQRTDMEYLNYHVPLAAERARGILAHPLEAERIHQVTEYLAAHTEPGEPIFVVPWAAGFYFLADRPNPTRADLFLFEDPAAYPCVLAALEADPPRYIVYGYAWDVDGRHFRDYARLVDAYIRTYYRIEVAFDGYEIWRRLDDVRAASIPSPTTACRPRLPSVRLIGGRRSG